MMLSINWTISATLTTLLLTTLVSSKKTDFIEEKAVEDEASFFWPNRPVCCKVGEKIAKKGFSCDTHEYLREGSYFEVYDHKAQVKRLTGSSDDVFIAPHVEELVRNAQICIFSRYITNFKKCCQYREEYTKELLLCREYKRGTERRSCRKQVHRRFP